MVLVMQSEKSGVKIYPHLDTPRVKCHRGRHRRRCPSHSVSALSTAITESTSLVSRGRDGQVRIAL